MVSPKKRILALQGCEHGELVLSAIDQGADGKIELHSVATIKTGCTGAHSTRHQRSPTPQKGPMMENFFTTDMLPVLMLKEELMHSGWHASQKSRVITGSQQEGNVSLAIFIGSYTAVAASAGGGFLAGFFKSQAGASHSRLHIWGSSHPAEYDLVADLPVPETVTDIQWLDTLAPVPVLAVGQAHR